MRASRDTKSTPPRPITGRSDLTMIDMLVSLQPVEEIPTTSTRCSRLAVVAVTIATQAVVATIGASPAQAVTYWVTTVADNTTADDQCTLREAMLAANNTPANIDCGPGSEGRDDIVFRAFVPFTVLAAPLPTITDSVLILGDVAFGTTIDANGRARAFVIDPGVDVTLSKLTITNAKAADGHAVSMSYATPGEDGGAIHNRGQLHLEDVRVTHSAAGRGGDTIFIGGKGGNGGAIYNAGTIIGFRVTFDENSAGMGGRTDSSYADTIGPGGHGGAIYNAAGGQITLYAATFWRNNQGRGATFYTPPTHGYGAALFSAGSAVIKASTFYENGIGFFTGVIVPDATGTVVLSSSLVLEPLGCRVPFGGLIVDGGFNSPQHATARCGAAAIQIPRNVDLSLFVGTLRNNGGYVPTLAIMSGMSDEVPSTFEDCAEGQLVHLGLPSTLTDARGRVRPPSPLSPGDSPNCDTGAYERIGPDARRALRTLTIAGAGSGHGTVTGDRIECAISAGASSGQCASEYLTGTVVAPTAIAAADSIFVGWEGDPECEDGSVVMNGAKSCTAIFDLRGFSIRGSADDVGNVRAPKTQGSAEVTFNAEFAFAGAVDLGSATLTIDALLNEEGANGAGELVEGLPIVLHALPGGGSTAAIFETPAGAGPRVTVEVQLAPSSLSTVAIAIEGATIARFPELCATATPSATTLTTRFTIDDGVNPPLTVTSREPWRCLAPIAGDRRQPQLLRTR
jgi:CSLREA domain-containing protein